MVIRWPVGGIRTFIRYVFRGFDTQNWSFTIIAPDIEEMRILIDDLSTQDVKFISTVPEPSPALLAIKVAETLMSGNYDIIHSHGFTSGLCSVGGSLLYRVPHIMTSHDVINRSQFDGQWGYIKRHIMSMVFSKIDIIHSVSNDAHNNLLEYFPTLCTKTGRCVVISNGIEIDRFRKAISRDLRGELGLSDNVFLIGFMGRFMAQKGFRYLVDAVELLVRGEPLLRHPLVLTFGDGGFIREEQAAIQKRGLIEFFTFLPFTDNIAGTVKGLDVVVMPSLWEACGLLAMETMLCGVPLIASDCIGLREVVQGTPAKIVSKADSHGLYKAILSEIEMSTRDDFENYIDIACEKYDVKRVRESLINTYNALLTR